MKNGKEENRASAGGFMLKDKDLFRTHYFLFVYEIHENVELYSKETRDVKLKTIGQIVNFNSENLIGELIYKEKGVKLNFRRVEATFQYDPNAIYEIYGIFHVISNY